MIDVLLPHYGDGRLARFAVASVMAQTSALWNLIIVDDHSPDVEAIQWMRELNHPCINFLRNDQNLGVNGNFRRCLELATSPYVVFLGCDDELLPDYIGLMTEAIARHPEVAMFQPRVDVIDELGNTTRTLVDVVKRSLMPSKGEKSLSGERFAASLLHGAWTYFPAICWRRDALISHPFLEGYDVALDLALILDLLIDGEEFLLLDQVAFRYRRHRQSASSLGALSTARFVEEARLFDSLRPALEARGWRKASRAAALHLTSRLHALALVGPALAGGDSAAALRLAQHAFSS